MQGVPSHSIFLHEETANWTNLYCQGNKSCRNTKKQTVWQIPQLWQRRQSNSWFSIKCNLHSDPPALYLYECRYKYKYNLCLYLYLWRCTVGLKWSVICSQTLQQPGAIWIQGATQNGSTSKVLHWWNFSTTSKQCLNMLISKSVTIANWSPINSRTVDWSQQLGWTVHVSPWNKSKVWICGIPVSWGNIPNSGAIENITHLIFVWDAIFKI